MQQTRKRAVPAPTSELLCSVKTFRARCTILYAISYMAKKRAVPAPTSEPLCKPKPFCARCTLLRAISYMAKKSCFFTKQLSYALQFCGFKSGIQSCPLFSVPSSSTSTSA